MYVTCVIVMCYRDCTDNVLSPALPADVQVCIVPVLSLRRYVVQLCHCTGTCVSGIV